MRAKERPHVNVDHQAALDRLVPQHLARGRALAAAADVDAPRVRVGKQRGVDQRLSTRVRASLGLERMRMGAQSAEERGSDLVVDKLVALCRLDEAVNHQRAVATQARVSGGCSERARGEAAHTHRPNGSKSTRSTVWNSDCDESRIFFSLYPTRSPVSISSSTHFDIACK